MCGIKHRFGFLTAIISDTGACRGGGGWRNEVDTKEGTAREMQPPAPALDQTQSRVRVRADVGAMDKSLRATVERELEGRATKPQLPTPIATAGGCLESEAFLLFSLLRQGLPLTPCHRTQPLNQCTPHRHHGPGVDESSPRGGVH